jgi:hypothetical protein
MYHIEIKPSFKKHVGKIKDEQQQEKYMEQNK